MSKKGGSHHFVRMRAHKRLGVTQRKAVKWLLAPSPGPHKKFESISVGVLVRDVIGRAENLREVKKLLNMGAVLIDGKKITEPKYPVGLMDIVSEPMEKKYYRMELSGPNLVPKPISAEAAARKYLKVALQYYRLTLEQGRMNGAHNINGNHKLDDYDLRALEGCISAHHQLYQNGEALVDARKLDELKSLKPSEAATKLIEWIKAGSL